MKDLVKSDKGKRKETIGYFNRYILNRIDRNKNFICCITGQTGSGKSYSALKEGELLDPNFDIRNVCFSPLEFIQLVNGKAKKLKRGSVIVYDEVQVTMSAQDFQSLQAKLINACLQTFRFRGFILFMTSPFFQFVNKSARKLFHSRWETVTINDEKKQAVLKPFLLQTNQETGQTFRKYLRIWTKETGVAPYKRIKLSLASEELRKAYEEKRQQFSENLNEEIERSLLKAEDNQKKPRPLTTRQKEIYEFIQKDGSLIKMVEMFGIVEQTLKDHIEYINKKIRYENKVICSVKGEYNKIIRYKIEKLLETGECSPKSSN